MSHNQENHFLHWNGDIANELVLMAIDGKESLSSPFLYELRSLTNKSESELASWHGKSVSCRIGNGNDAQPQRLLHGVITSIRYKHTQQDAICILTLEPSLALLAMGRQMRVWQNISVPDLINELLSTHGITQIERKLYRKYSKREYCIQYRESDLEFIQRLLDEEGIYYFFRHTESGHSLVLIDHPAGHDAVQGEKLVWHHDGDIFTEGCINSWSSTTSLIPSNVVLHGLNMQQAAAIEEQKSANPSLASVNTITFTDITPAEERSLISSETQNVMAAHEANTRIFDATVNAHWLCSGEIFTLTGHPSDDRCYRIHSLTFYAINNTDDNSGSFDCQLQAMSNEQPWHPPYPQRPEIHGMLTATVVGPSSEDIHTDKYGRIKIHFPWDKVNPHDDSSSCWIRVAQPWAGGKFGAQFIPRIGSEVLVSFVQGDPDYPLVVGTVYNGQNQLPFDLPGNKTESGFVTRSTTKGDVNDGHRLTFNDKKDEELLTIVAQKDLSLTVKNDVVTTIAANRSTELTKGNERLLLKQGDIDIRLAKGNWQQKVTGNATTEINNGNYVLKVSGGSGSVKTDNALTLESTESIELKVGSNTINLSTNGISINGVTLILKSESSTEFKGKTISIDSTGPAEIKGEVLSVTGSKAANISGGALNISGTELVNILGKLIKIG